MEIQLQIACYVVRTAQDKTETISRNIKTQIDQKHEHNKSLKRISDKNTKHKHILQNKPRNLSTKGILLQCLFL